ncbi:hypothetical protein CFC21_076334 [Triticum aestivum]|uniref:Diaminopimelate epimerase n=1 Tax=Triticum aestivum TaxID=4565 RepID=A0A9R1KYB8_WHEAT|nr:hypothetical protein CFC21_076334 [Triticum aestivum]
MSPAAAAARATSFAANFTTSTAPSSGGRLLRPFRGNPRPRRAVASMAVSAPKSPAAASFLERRESERALHFVKYQGLGNDFIMMCGNGVRCFARFIAEVENLQGTHSFKIHTGAGLIIPEIQDDGKVKVDMGEPILYGPDVPTKLPSTKNEAVVKAELAIDGLAWHVTCVSMGNPHCITFGSKELKVLHVDDLKLSDIGPKFEHHEMFPARTNTEFVEVLSRSHLKMRVWERGAGATLACGTGACAVVVAAVLEGRAERKCVVDLPGGPLEIEWREDNNHVYMTGPAEAVFYGSVVH